MPRPTSALLLITILLLPGCFRHEPVRHLASDVCLMSQGTTKQEVMTYMGPPSERQADQSGEIWIYYQVNKSLLRKTPFIGNNLGSEDVDIVTVRFAGDKVTTCAYRSMTKEEFKNSGILQTNDASDSQ